MHVKEGAAEPAETAIMETVYTKTVMKQALISDKHLKDIVDHVADEHPELKGVMPNQVLMDKIDEKTITLVTYDNITSIYIIDEKTGKM